VRDALLVAGIRWRSVASLVVASAAIMGSPGPATISLVAVVSSVGLRRSLPYAFGIAAGTAAVLVAVACGITVALLAVPGVRPVLIGVSAAYIVWLAYRIAVAPPAADRGMADAPSLGAGTFLGVANPKGWIAIAAVFATGRLFASEVADGMAKVIVLSAMIVAIMAAWLVAGASLAPLLRRPRAARVVNSVFAVVLVAATAVAVRH
jgi:threonine/homoserine/homoserine lactone efflux protein